MSKLKHIARSLGDDELAIVTGQPLIKFDNGTVKQKVKGTLTIGDKTYEVKILGGVLNELVLVPASHSKASTILAKARIYEIMRNAFVSAGILKWLKIF
jgi:hypothetical protein